MREIQIPSAEMIPKDDLSPHLRGPMYPEDLEHIVPPVLRAKGKFERTVEYLQGIETSKKQKIIGAVVIGVLTYGLARALRDGDDFIGGHNID